MQQASGSFQVLPGGSNYGTLGTSFPLLTDQQLQEKYTSSWLWRTLACLIENKDFDPSPYNIALKLNVEVEQVVEAFEGLLRLGIIRRALNGYERVFRHVQFSDRQLNPRRVLADHVLINTQIMGRLDPAATHRPQYYRTSFLATNQQLLKDFCVKVDTLLKELIEESNKKPSDGVFAIGISGVGMVDCAEKPK